MVPELNLEPPQLQLTSLSSLSSSHYPYSGALTPLHTSASVPFSWEQEPGKPLPCLTLSISVNKCLDLPPRLLNETKCSTKTLSPTTVLEGPCNSLGRSILGSSSFRFLRRRQKSYDGTMNFAGSGGSSPERGLIDTVVSGGGCGGDGATVTVGKPRRMRRQLGLSQAKSHFWANIYGTFKQAIPRRRRN